MARFIISTEDSEVDKVYDEEHNSEDSSNSSELSTEVKALIDENKEKEETPEEEQAANDVQPEDGQGTANQDADPEEVTEEEASETDGEADTDDSDDTAGDEADEEDGGNELNAASEMIMESFQIILAAESDVNLLSKRAAQEGIGESLKESSLQAAAYLKNAGIEYGPKLFKFLGKSIIFALGMTLKGLHKSTKALGIAVEDSRNSYIKLGQRVKNIEASLALLKEQGIEKVKPGVLYTKESVIRALYTGSEFKPQTALIGYKAFLKNYIGSNTERAEKSYYGLRQLFGRVALSEVNDMTSAMFEAPATQGLTQSAVPGYKAINADVEVYHYPQSLPGNLLFMAYLPKKDLETPEEVYTAYRSSRFFIGLNLNQAKGFGKVPYLNASEVAAMLKEIKEIQIWGDEYLKNLKELTGYKKLIEYNLRSMAQKLTAKVTTSKQEVQAIEYINLKIYFFQKCFIRDMVDIERTNRRILLSYVRYMEASVLALAQTS